MTTLNSDSTIHDVVKLFKSQTDQKTYVITGPSEKSLGAAAARGLAEGTPKRLILVGRSKEKVQPVVDDIKNKNPLVSVHFVLADFQDNSTVRKAATEIASITPEIHGLINCAGIMGRQVYTKSKDGIESQFATNHVAHFLLTNLLMDQLAKGSGVIINVSSGGQMLTDRNLEDPNFQDGATYDGWIAYGRSKAANILFTLALAKRVSKFQGASFAINPGYVAETSLQNSSEITPDIMMRGFELALERNGGVPAVPRAVTVDQGAATIVIGLLDPGLKESSGAWIEDCQIGSVPGDSEDAEKLWHLSEKLVGQNFSV